MRLLQILALTCCSCLSCCPRFFSQSTEEPDAGEGRRRRARRVQAQDVSLGCDLLAEGQRTTARDRQVAQYLLLPRHENCCAFCMCSYCSETQRQTRLNNTRPLPHLSSGSHLSISL